MIKIERLFEYIPASHGEHGVDATLHALAEICSNVHEVFSNPPGGSWTQFDIMRPETKLMFRWDHMPRVTAAKRPDLVIQKNIDSQINLICIESKRIASQLEDNTGERLVRYFTDPEGIRNKPAWHYQDLASKKWCIIPPDDEPEKSYWFRDYPLNKINFKAGFAYGLDQEYLADIQNLDTRIEKEKMIALLEKDKNLDLILAIGWQGQYHFPFLLREFSQNFKDTEFANSLDQMFKPLALDLPVQI